VDTIPEDVSVILISAYTASSRLEEQTVVPIKDIIRKKFPSTPIFFVVFRFGEKAVPAKIMNDKDDTEVVPSLSVNYTNPNGMAMTTSSTEAIIQIMKSFLNN